MTSSEPGIVQDTGVVRGRVKWFDATRGFGFVVADEGGLDILLPGDVLHAFGVRTVQDGSPIVIALQITEKGRRVAAILSLEAPAPAAAGADLPSEIQFIDPAHLAALPLEPARVKWFDIEKGFGFLTVWGQREDVFLHLKVLRRSGLGPWPPARP